MLLTMHRNGAHDETEMVLTMNRNGCSRWAGMVLTMGRNTQRLSRVRLPILASTCLMSGAYNDNFV